MLRTTLDQASAVRDVVEQQTRSKGGLLDQALTQRKRTAALSRLGEEVYRMAKRGQLGELMLEPEIGMLIEELEQLDDDGGPKDGYGPSSDHEAVSSADYATRFNKPATGNTSGEGEYRVWRPVMPDEADIIDTDEEAEVDSAPEPVAPARSSRMPRRSAERRGGGIHFADRIPNPEDPENDDDLASYMHDDDVPEE